MGEPAHLKWDPIRSSGRADFVRAAVVTLLPSAAPNYQEQLDAGKFYCVIEKHDEPFNFAAPSPESFLWLCAKSSLPVRKAFAHYKNRCPKGDDNFIVTAAGNSTPLDVDGELKFKDLAAPSGGILLLTATRKAVYVGSTPFNSAVEATASGRQRPAAEGGGIHSDSSGVRLPQTPSRASPRGTPHKSEAPKTPTRSQLSKQPTPRSIRGLKQRQSNPASGITPLHERDVNTAPITQVADEPQYQPRMLDNPFVKDENEPESEHPARGGPLAQLTNEETPERLEAAVQAGLEILSTLEAPLREVQANEETAAWLEQISKIKESAIKTRTVVGVVGNTGAGKSSVINAMLDEERLGSNKLYEGKGNPRCG